MIHAEHKFELIVNKGKTKVMATDGSVLDIKVDGEVLEQVDRFTYLGTITTANRDCGADIKARIGLAKNVLSKLGLCRSFFKPYNNNCYNIVTLRLFGTVMEIWRLKDMYTATYTHGQNDQFHTLLQCSLRFIGGDN